MVEKYIITEKRVITPKKPKGSAWYYLGLVGQIGYTIALPIAGGALLGSFFDSKLASGRMWTLNGLGLGIFISAVGFFSVIRDVLKASK